MGQSGTSPVQRSPQRHDYKTYICRNFCTSRKMAWVDELIEELIVARLEMPDALFTEDEYDDSELREKRARLESFYDSAAEGEISPQALGRIEGRLLAEIRALEKTLTRYVPSSVLDLREGNWNDLTLDQKREVVRTLVDVRLLPGHRGSRRFDPETIEVTWRG